MKSYAVLSGVLAILSLCIVDDNIQPAVAKFGRVSLVIFSVLFVVTEALYLMS